MPSRAAANPFLKRSAQARRMWMRAWSAGCDDASRRASARTGTARSSCSNSARRSEGLGAQRAALRLGQQIVGDRSRTRPFPGSEMRTSRGERPSVALVARVRRRQAQRVLGELGRERRCAAIGRKRAASSSTAATPASGDSVDSAR